MAAVPRGAPGIRRCKPCSGCPRAPESRTAEVQVSLEVFLCVSFVCRSGLHPAYFCGMFFLCGSLCVWPTVFGLCLLGVGRGRCHSACP